MLLHTTIGILIPFIGTSLGAAMVFVLKDKMSEKLQKGLTGFAAGVMVAASFWSLLVPLRTIFFTWKAVLYSCSYRLFGGCRFLVIFR